MIKFSKRMLALIMSMLMIFSCMAVSASATGEGTEPPAGEEPAPEITTVNLTVPNPEFSFDQETLKLTVKPVFVPESAAEDAHKYPTKIELTLGETKVDGTTNADGSITFAGIELRSEYSIKVSIVDNVTDTKDVKGEKTVKVTPTVIVPSIKSKCVFDKTNRTITVQKLDGLVVGGKTYTIAVDIQPTAKSVVVGDGTTVFSELKYGETYTVRGYVLLSATDAPYYTAASGNFVQKIDKQQSKPAAPTPTEITSKSIKINAEKGVKYTITGPDNFKQEKFLEEGKTSIEFKALTPGTSYTIAAQRPAMEGFYASEKVTLSVTTKKEATDKVPSLRLVDKSNKSITVEAYFTDLAEGETAPAVEYRLNNGSWQSSGEFKNLTANTQYNLYARVKFNANEEASTISEPLAVKTNAAPNYEADENKITFSCKDGQYTNAEVSFKVKGDGPADMNKAVFGDTRIVPVSFVVMFGEDTVASGTFNGKKLEQTGKFTPAEAYSSKTVNVIVTFKQEKYKGVDGEGTAKWEAYGETDDDIFIESSYAVKLGRAKGPMTKITEFFEVIANFLFNIVPAFLAEAMKSDIWARMLKLLGQLGTKLG